MRWSTDIFSGHLAARLSGDMAPILDWSSRINHISHFLLMSFFFFFNILIGSSQEIPEAQGHFIAIY